MESTLAMKLSLFLISCYNEQNVRSREIRCNGIFYLYETNIKINLPYNISPSVTIPEAPSHQKIALKSAIFVEN